MHTVLSKKYLLTILLILLMSGEFVLARNMFRWVDDKGNVKYSDQVPPDQVKHKRESLNENIRVVDTVNKEKTEAQRELEKRLLLLRKQQEDIINKQKAHDKVLLSTFRNVDDMKMSLKGKMKALDGQRTLIDGNLQRAEKQLQLQQKRAAQFERDGKKVPIKFLKSISTRKQQIDVATVEIARHIEKKNRIKNQIETDIERFIFLTQSNAESKDLSRKTGESKAANLLGLYICETVEQCEQAWLRAKQFVLDFSTTQLDSETDRLIIALVPYRDTDLSLSVSRMDVENKKQQLFLDIRCRKSSLGKELCAGERAKKIRYSFSNYIKSALAIDKAQQTPPLD